MPYELKRSAGKFLFNLKGEQHEVLLTSGFFPKREDALAAIETVRKLGADSKSYEMRRAATGSPFFVLKARANEVLVKSEVYESESAAFRAMQVMTKQCSTVDLRDWS
jgi:uncharacterized protein YegP (UPF0339 family)